MFMLLCFLPRYPALPLTQRYSDRSAYALACLGGLAMPYMSGDPTHKQTLDPAAAGCALLQMQFIDG